MESRMTHKYLSLFRWTNNFIEEGWEPPQLFAAVYIPEDKHQTVQNNCQETDGTSTMRMTGGQWAQNETQEKKNRSRGNET